MKRAKALFLALLASAFGLSSCEFNLGFLKIGESEKIVKDDSEENQEKQENLPDAGKESEQSYDEEGDSSPTEPTSKAMSFDEMKEFAIHVYSDIYEIDPDDVNVSYYGDNSDYFDVYTYNQDGLMFVNIDMDFDGLSVSEVHNLFKEYLPEGATYDENRSILDEDYDTYIYFYKTQTEYFVFYIEDWYSFIWATFDIVPLDQVDAYFELCYGEEDYDD